MRYQFEINDLRALITLLNVVLIMCFGVALCWCGVAVAVCGLIKDFTIDRKINGIVMHSANVLLNVYLLTLL